MTAKLMNVTGGQVLVGIIGLAIIGYGIYQIVQAWTEKFAEKLDGEGRSGKSGTAYIAFGKAGYAARGVAFVIVGGLFGYAAITHDAEEVRRPRPGALRGARQALRPGHARA